MHSTPFLTFWGRGRFPSRTGVCEHHLRNSAVWPAVITTRVHTRHCVGLSSGLNARCQLSELSLEVAVLGLERGALGRLRVDTKDETSQEEAMVPVLTGKDFLIRLLRRNPQVHFFSS